MINKEKGDIALAHAIKHYLTNGYEVCLPIGDKRVYDLLVEQNGIVHKIQVKYAGIYTSSGKCKVGLRTTGGNQSYYYAKKYADDAFDFLFIYTAKNQCYSIPWCEVTARNEISIEHDKYQRYIITQR